LQTATSHQLQLLLSAFYYCQFFITPVTYRFLNQKSWRNTDAMNQPLSPRFSNHRQITVSDKAWAVASWQSKWWCRRLPRKLRRQCLYQYIHSKQTE
jgi:hypothetical protein